MSQVDVSWATLWRIFFFIIFGALLYLAQDILVIVFLAIVFSSGLDLPVSILEKHKIPRVIGTIFIFLAILSIVGFILYALIPVALTQSQEFLNHAARLRLPALGPIDVSALLQTLSQNLNNISGVVFSGSASVLGAIAAIFGNAVLVVTTLVLTFYLTIDREGIEKFLRAILPLSHEEQAIAIYYRVRRRFGLWLKGQVVLMLVIATVVFAGLWLLGVPYALVIALLAGLLEIVPYVGPIFAGTIAFLLGLSESLSLGVYAALLFIVVQQLENQLFVPLIMKKTVGVNPVVVVVAIILGVKVAGFVGVLIAVPMVVLLEEILEDWGQEKLRRRGYQLGV